MRSPRKLGSKRSVPLCILLKKQTGDGSPTPSKPGTVRLSPSRTIRQQSIKLRQAGLGTNFVKSLLHFVSRKFSFPRECLQRSGQIERNVFRKIIKYLRGTDH